MHLRHHPPGSADLEIPSPCPGESFGPKVSCLHCLTPAEKGDDLAFADLLLGGFLHRPCPLGQSWELAWVLACSWDAERPHSSWATGFCLSLPDAACPPALHGFSGYISWLWKGLSWIFPLFSLALTHSAGLSPTQLWHSRLMSTYDVQSPPATPLPGQSLLKKLDTCLGLQPDESPCQGSVMLIKQQFLLCSEPPSHPWPFLVFLADTGAK